MAGNKTKDNNNIRFVSWNIKGVNQITKLNKVMAHLSQFKGDILFLQETHLRAADVPRLKKA